MDLPGHGRADALRATLEETADLVVDALGDEPVALGGYSFGGRVALHIALRHPERLRSLLVLGASRGIEDPRERLERRNRDYALAEHIEEVGTASFLDEWLSAPMFADLPDDPFERSARSTSARGLADSLCLAGTGTQAWLDPKLSSISVPTLALAGANDTKFAAEARAIGEGVPHGSWDVIPGAGHAAHLERPLACAERVLTFLA